MILSNLYTAPKRDREGGNPRLGFSKRGRFLKNFPHFFSVFPKLKTKKFIVKFHSDFLRIVFKFFTNSSLVGFTKLWLI